LPILIFIVTVAAGCLLGFLIKPKGRREIALSRIYVIIASLLVLNAALVNFANIQNAAFLNVLVFVLNWGKSLNFFLIGYFLVRISRILKSGTFTENSYPLNDILGTCLWAITIINGFAFFIETGYKLKNFDDLVQQFKEYGYARWFLYFIIITETLGGTGILLHFKLKTGPSAALGLMLIMLGVVYTNWHVHDPFDYSFPAVDAFMSLFLMSALYRLENRSRQHASGIPRYVSNQN
jgi:uncharacterized membrane protein YphA (DoxX/SURF4 family)